MGFTDDEGTLSANTEQKLKQMMGQFGTVLNVSSNYPQYAFVDFNESKAAIAALNSTTEFPAFKIQQKTQKKNKEVEMEIEEGTIPKTDKTRQAIVMDKMETDVHQETTIIDSKEKAAAKILIKEDGHCLYVILFFLLFQDVLLVHLKQLYV